GKCNGQIRQGNRNLRILDNLEFAQPMIPMCAHGLITESPGETGPIIVKVLGTCAVCRRRAIPSLRRRRRDPAGTNDIHGVTNSTDLLRWGTRRSSVVAMNIPKTGLITAVVALLWLIYGLFYATQLLAMQAQEGVVLPHRDAFLTAITSA